MPYRVFAHDDTGEIALTFFHAQAAYLEKAMPVGEHVVVSGRMEWFNGRPTMVHPDHIALASDAENLPLIEPVYPLTAGLSAKVLRRAIGQALGRLPELPEWQDDAFMRRQTFPPLPMRSPASTIPPTRSMSPSTARPGGGSPMTNCWPARSRWRWCAHRSAGCPAGRWSATAASSKSSAPPCPIR